MAYTQSISKYCCRVIIEGDKTEGSYYYSKNNAMFLCKLCNTDSNWLDYYYQCNICKQTFCILHYLTHQRCNQIASKYSLNCIYNEISFDYFHENYGSKNAAMFTRHFKIRSLRIQKYVPFELASIFGSTFTLFRLEIMSLIIDANNYELFATVFSQLPSLTIFGIQINSHGEC